MKPIILLAAVLMLSKVIGHDEVNFTRDEDAAETQPSINGRSTHVEADLCGETKVVITHVKRGDRIFNDEETSDDNVDELPNLDKILGGTYATYGEFPWMVTILYKNHHTCGGAIISEFWVVSAAHCFYGRDTEMFTVVVGNHHVWNFDSHEKTHSVANIIKHEKYRPEYTGADIALVKIKPTWDGRGIRYNDYIQPICLPYFYERPLATAQLQFSGWGRTSEGSGRSSVLKKTILPVIDYGTCKYYFNQQLTPNDFCDGYVHGDTDVCRGISGSPLVHREGSYIVYGISALGSGCSRSPNNPAIFTSVALYRGWIDDNIRLNGNGSELNMPQRRVADTSPPAK